MRSLPRCRRSYLVIYWRRYEALSAAFAAGHTRRVVAAAAGMLPPALSRMIRQDTARSHRIGGCGQGRRTGRVDGWTVRWFVASFPLKSRGVEALSSFRREHARNGLQRPAGTLTNVPRLDVVPQGRESGN